LLYAPIAAREVLGRVTAKSLGDVDFRLLDAGSSGRPVLYDSASETGTSSSSAPGYTRRSAMFQTARKLEMAGRSFDVDIRSTPQLESGAGRVEGVLVTAVGVFLTTLSALALLHLRRRHDQAEATTRERERLIRLMTENIPARLSYWDRELRCLLLNRSLSVLFGRSPEDVIGKRLDQLLPADKWQLLAPRLQAALAGKQQQFEWSTTATDGRPGTALFYCVPDVQREEVAGLLLVSIDITELKEAQEKAQRASEAKSQFLSNMSHELRTPMNAVLGMLSLLRITKLDAQQDDYASKAEAAARSLLHLLDDILDVSKIEAGKMTLDPKPFSTRALLDELELILSTTIGGKPLTLRLEVDPNVPTWLLADEMRLRQVLINLGGNAIKFTPAGEVTVGVRQVERKGDRVLLEFSVTDTGIGIASEDHQRIFGEFSQASASTTRKYGGSGLGLSICRRLLALMGTELRLESSPGQGSRFHFVVWLTITQPPLEAKRESPLEPQDLWKAKPLGGYRLLLVEDNLVNQQVARGILQSAGAEVEIAENGREAVLAVAGRGPFDAVLMDIQMPVMDGFQAAREIRTKLSRTDLPIIALSANAMENDRQQSRAAGMVAHVGKPFVPRDLVRVLLQHIRGGDERLSAQARGLAAPSADTCAIIDRAAAVARLGGDQQLYQRLIPMFIKDLRSTLAKLPELSETDRKDVTRIFHSLKSIAATMGAIRLSEAAAAAEEASKHETAILGPLILRPVVEEIEATLTAFRDQGGG
jgi:PAS domain S-box-containing protein